MANVVRGLLVTLGLDAAEYTAGLSKAEYQAKKTLENISRSASSVANTIKGLGAAFGVGIGVGAFVHLIKSTIDAAEHLENLSKSTGIAVTTLGGLGFAATQTGSSLDGMAAAFKKFNVNASGAAAGNEGLLESFNAVGISLKDLQTLTPDQLFIKTAAAFASFEEGTAKAARGSEIFGKAYQDIIPTLDQGAAKLQQNIAYFEKFGGVSAQVARDASEFNTELAKAGLLSGAFGRNLTAELLGPMRELLNSFVDAREKGGQFREEAKAVAEVVTNLAVGILYLGKGFSELGDAIGSAMAQLDRLAHLDFAGVSFIHDDELKRIDEADAKFEKLIARIRGAQNEFKDKQVFGGDLPTGNTRQEPTRKAATGGGADASKKILDAQLAVLDRFIKAEEDLLRLRERFLEDYYRSDELDIAAYFGRRAAILNDAIAAEVAAFGKEEALLRARISRKAATPVERAEDQKKLDDVIARRAKAEQDAAVAGITLFRDERKAVQEFQRSIEEVALAVTHLRGDTVEAAGFGFDLQNRQIIERIRLEKESTNEEIKRLALIGDKYVTELRQRTVEQAAFNAKAREYSGTLADVGIAQARVDLLAQTGALTEIGAMNKRADLAREFVVVLTKQADAAEKAALAMSAGPDREDALRFVQRMRLEIDQLAAAAEALNNKFRDVFTSAFADNFSAFITGAKSAKDALRDFVKSVEKSIADIASKEIGEQLFGKGGALGGIPEFFGKAFGGGTKGIFGGAGEATGAAALTGAGATLTASGATLAAAGISLDAAAIAITSAAGTLAAGGAASSLGGGSSFVSELFSGFGAFASGGTPPMNRASLVGERGPELFMPKSSGTIIPFDVLKRGRGKSVTVNVNANFAGQMSTKSATQAGRELGLQINRAVSRS